MKISPLVLALSLALLAPGPKAVAHTDASMHAIHSPTDPTTPQESDATDLHAVQVTATLDRARNGLSPGTGSSQYVIDHEAIAQLPLGNATPVNQVLLQAPGVVQDAHGSLHVRGDHANLQYRINGVIIPESIGGFGQTLDARTVQNIKLLDGALPAQYGLRTAAVVDITTKNGRRLGNGGSAGITGGSFGTLNPHVSVWGNDERLSWFFTANYLESDIGIENPTPSRKPIHDHTNQLKAFGNVSWLIDEDTRLSFMFGMANNRFEIPNNPNQKPGYGHLNRTDFDSRALDERQREQTRFGVLSLQGKMGKTDYQVSLGQRYSGLDFMPDRIGNLMFNGVASTISRGNRASTLQADFATPLGSYNTLRYGIYGSHESAPSTNDAWVFPADADGNQTSTTPINIVDTNRIVAKTWSAYVQDEWSINDKLTMNYGLRGDVYKAFRTESQLSPRVGLVYQATWDTTLHAGYARYFTPPATAAITATDIARFDGTTNQVPDNGNNTPLSERSDYYDVGIQHHVGDSLTLGLDAYYRRIQRLQDEGQFGAALVYATFNYARGRVHGVEFTANYDRGPVSAYFNMALSRAQGTRVITSQYNFDPVDLAYVASHYIHLDHDQKLASSGGITYAVTDDTRIGANYLYGSGLRRDGKVPNGATMPAYFQLNLSLSHDVRFGNTGKLHVQLAVINALDRVYELRDGTGIGVGAPQYGPRRGFYLGIDKDF
ncbi:MAG TPA: TonB-dependent receptor [Oleiagrimonas sp.]|nr:TonB-dependent receptor [Oleiagrimonas sp.]